MIANFGQSAASNESTFWPAACSDANFLAWATRALIRLRNQTDAGRDLKVARALFKDGLPEPQWAEAFVFMLRQNGPQRQKANHNPNMPRLARRSENRAPFPAGVAPFEGQHLRGCDDKKTELRKLPKS